MSGGPACPVKGCVNKRSTAHMMCRSHWSRVPKALQADVYRLWDEFRTQRDQELRMAAYRAYLAVRKRALDHLGGEKSDADR